MFTAYDFVKTDFTKKVDARVKAKWNHYDARELERLLIGHNPNKDLREQVEYKNAQNAIVDVTMSCNSDECEQWLRYFESNAIAYGLVTNDKMWGYFFLAAKDLYEEVRFNNSVELLRFTQHC